MGLKEDGLRIRLVLLIHRYAPCGASCKEAIPTVSGPLRRPLIVMRWKDWAQRMDARLVVERRWRVLYEPFAAYSWYGVGWNMTPPIVQLPCPDERRHIEI